MAKTIGIGIQDFEKIITRNAFYIDKTSFIKEWWESGDDVTLITRPRRFGKTLTMSMVEHFFSNRYTNQKQLFEHLSIGENEEYKKLQGNYPVISLSFSNVKENTFSSAYKRICQIITNLYSEYPFLKESNVLTEKDREFFNKISYYMEEIDAAFAIHQLSNFLYQYYNKKVIILLDEYDTPMQEAYVNGYWTEMTGFIRNLFNSTFKTNPYLERAIMTGITRISKESIFSDLNNLKVVTTTSNKYATTFGFTETEVFSAMDEIGLTNKEEVKTWYDGFIFGSVKDIYNPWSITNFLDNGILKAYWANTSSNHLAGTLIQSGDKDTKLQFEQLLQGMTIQSEIDEEIVYSQLENNRAAIWSLLLASGYLKVLSVEEDKYDLALTNYEVKRMFRRIVKDWFAQTESSYNDFIKALLLGDIKAMNRYMNHVALNTFSYFDTGNRPSGEEPERFYHGFVLGLLVELSDRYILTSNRESGFGRYDVMLEPLHKEDDGIILEFKVHEQEEEQTLHDTVKAALQQIEDKKYEQLLVNKNIPKNRIRKYGFAFQGKTVLIG